MKRQKFLFNIGFNPQSDPKREYLKNAFHSSHLVQSDPTKGVEAMLKEEFEIFKMDEKLATKLRHAGVLRQNPVPEPCVGCERESIYGLVWGSNFGGLMFNMSVDEEKQSGGVRRPLPVLYDCIWEKIRSYLEKTECEMKVDYTKFAFLDDGKTCYWFEDLELAVSNTSRYEGDSLHDLFVRAATIKIKPIMIYRATPTSIGEYGVLTLSRSKSRKKLYWVGLDDLTTCRQLNPHDIKKNKKKKKPSFKTLVYADVIKPKYYVCYGDGDKICCDRVCVCVCLC